MVNTDKKYEAALAKGVVGSGVSGVLGGTFKIARGLFKVGLGGGKYDGPMQVCSKCGMPHHGICTSCASKEGADSIRQGIEDIKNSF